MHLAARLLSAQHFAHKRQRVDERNGQKLRRSLRKSSGRGDRSYIFAIIADHHDSLKGDFEDSPTGVRFVRRTKCRHDMQGRFKILWDLLSSLLFTNVSPTVLSPMHEAYHCAKSHMLRAVPYTSAPLPGPESFLSVHEA